MTESETTTFGTALNELKEGRVDSITRNNWWDSDAPLRIRIQQPDEHSKMTEPYLYMEKYKNDTSEDMIRFPCDLSCESILADDWVLLKD